MPFAPHEIESKKFVVALRGYRPDEVDAFLRAVAADYRALLEEAQQEAPREWIGELERVLRSARAEADAEAREILRAAEEEAAAIRATAERDAATLREAAQEEAEACYAEVARQADELRCLEERLRSQLHALELTVVEGRQALDHVGLLYSVAPADEAPTRAA